MTEAVETLARVSRAVVCGHDTERGRRGPAPRLCERCRLSAELAMRLRQAAKVAAQLRATDLTRQLSAMADESDPR